MIQSCDTGQQIPWWTYIYWQQTILWEPKFLGCIDNQILVNYSAPLQSETKLLGRITIFNRVLTSLHQPHFWFNVVKRLFKQFELFFLFSFPTLKRGQGRHSGHEKATEFHIKHCWMKCQEIMFSKNNFSYYFCFRFLVL